MFGPAMTMTADAPVSALLRDVTGAAWVNSDTEVETGCGIVPFAYREQEPTSTRSVGRSGWSWYPAGRDPGGRCFDRPSQRRLVPALPEI